MTNVFKSIAILLLVIMTSGILAAQEAPKARLLPNKQYRVIVKKTLAGNDGFREIIPNASIQTVIIETGSPDASGIPATLTANRDVPAEQSDASPSADWVFRFAIAPDGALTDVSVVSGEEQISEKLAYGLLSKYLGAVLFSTEYKLKDGTLPNITLAERGESGGAVTFKYTVPQNSERTAGGQPIVANIKGDAHYDTALGMYTRRTVKQEDRIYVAEDAVGEEKEVIMRRDITYEVTVSDAK